MPSRTARLSSATADILDVVAASTGERVDAVVARAVEHLAETIVWKTITEDTFVATTPGARIVAARLLALLPAKVRRRVLANVPSRPGRKR